MYPLALSVINDSASYSARRHAARRFLQCGDLEQYRRDIRAVTNEAARRERASFGVKIKPADVTAQAREVADYMLRHECETIASQYPRETKCEAIIRRWFDKVNGNSYWSAIVRVPQRTESGDTFTLVRMPFQYGYGSHPEHAILSELKRLGILAQDASIAPADACPVTFDDRGYMPRRCL